MKGLGSGVKWDSESTIDFILDVLNDDAAGAEDSAETVQMEIHDGTESDELVRFVDTLK